MKQEMAYFDPLNLTIMNKHKKKSTWCFYFTFLSDRNKSACKILEGQIYHSLCTFKNTQHALSEFAIVINYGKLLLYILNQT